MFTGIIETVGVVRSLIGSSGGSVVSIDLGKCIDGVCVGDSIAVNGTCLTVGRVKGSVCDFDVSNETVSKSTIGKLVAGTEVNIERAMRSDGRFGGHIVQGHVDGTGSISGIEKKGEFAEICFSVSSELLDEIVAKGSVAIDGISLTVARMDAKDFVVSVIPMTMNATTLAKAKIGNTVNIETDIITKTIRKQLSRMLGGQGGGVTMDKLRQFGF